MNPFLKRLAVVFLALGAFFPVFAQNGLPESAYKPELNIEYCKVDGKTLFLNAFLPPKAEKPVPAMVYIYGGWFFGGGRAGKVQDVPGWDALTGKGYTVFSMTYRLGQEGGFPQTIRDCRNAIRFIRKNANRFNIDPNRIGVTGISAGGYLSLMVAMVPEDFADGGPTEGLEGVSARVCSCFGYIGPTDFNRFWNQAPEDVITNANGTIKFRAADDKIPNDARPRMRILFHGVVPDTETNKNLYYIMSPIAHVRKDVAPLLICDGEKDPIVPGLHGKVLSEQLKAAGADVTYWMTPNGGHGYPGGAGFRKVLDDFLNRTMQ